jgi:rhodanese-related sulfurtransferase
MFKSLFGQTVRRTAVNIIRPINVQEKLDKNETVIILDVRQPMEYERDGHILGSRLMPLGTLMTRLDELPTDTPIICVCRSGARSHTACEQLSSQGFSDVTNMGGGMTAWKRSGLPFK